MSESVWVLGAAMTKIARYDDKDVVDLAAEATFDALDDAGVSIFDVQVLAAGSLFTQGGIGQHDLEADRPDRHPDLQRHQRVRDRRDRGAHRAHVDQGRRVRHRPRGRLRADGQDGPARRRGPGQVGAEGLRAGGPLRWRDAPRGNRWARAPCPRCSARRAWSTRTPTTAWASSSSPRSRRRTTRTPRSTRSRSTRRRSRSTRS